MKIAVWPRRRWQGAGPQALVGWGGGHIVRGSPIGLELPNAGASFERRG